MNSLRGPIETRGVCDEPVNLSLVGLPPDSPVGSDSKAQYSRGALGIGVDVVGGIPYK